MELDGDGHIDILSGSYSWHEQPMAGVFQLLRGSAGGGFRAAETLPGSDGKPLVITPRGDGDDAVVERICTRPFAVDLDGDGRLDLVAGNFRGTFAVFRGEAGGTFAPQNTWLEADGVPLQVDCHSDPFLVDWDGDGDFDLLSGSAEGGAFLFTNLGSRTAPTFAATPTTLLAPHERTAEEPTVAFGDAHLTQPTRATRVWADDVDGDGKLDLLLGDSITLCHLQPGVDEAAARTAIAAWKKRQEALLASRGEGEPSEADENRVIAAFEALQQERAQVVRDEMTGFVWVMYRQ